MTDLTRPPHVVIMHCHDLGRFLGCYGNPTVHSPALDRLAGQGVRFANSFCTAPQCSPSRAALFTGRYPHSTGVLGLTHKNFAWDMHPGERHLASLLGEHGYWTAIYGVHHESRQLSEPEIAARLGFDEISLGGHAPVVAERARAAVREMATSDRPYYLQIGFNEPHRVAPPKDGYRTGFLHAGMESDDSAGVAIPPFLVDDESTRAEIAELQGAVRYVDEAIGSVLAEIDEAGLTDSTIVVFTTDHGLALPRAKCTLYDPGIETALIMRGPGEGWSGGRVVDGLVSNVDVVPTLLEAVGVPLPDNLHGRSLGVRLDGTTQPGARDRLFAEMTFHNYYDPRRCIRTNQYKLIVNFDAVPAYSGGASQSWRPWSSPKVAPIGLAGPQDETVELYDLSVDPDEFSNVAKDPAYAEAVAELQAALGAWMRDTGDPLYDGPVASPSYDRARAFVGGGSV